MGRTKGKKKGCGVKGKNKSRKMASKATTPLAAGVREDLPACETPGAPDTSTSLGEPSGRIRRHVLRSKTVESAEDRAGQLEEARGGLPGYEREAGGQDQPGRHSPAPEASKTSRTLAQVPDEPERHGIRGGKRSLEDKIAPLLQEIRGAGISPFDIVLCLLDEDSSTYHTKCFAVSSPNVDEGVESRAHRHCRSELELSRHNPTSRRKEYRHARLQTP
ncbi:hypothetical protein CC2G_005341 [Coprinopsis cinerea AmutBmut pab1-1]|nr:hypothetical protein CC2G_005341 [Coprinopsis cinerea AmutBmut pab1-1]